MTDEGVALATLKEAESRDGILLAEVRLEQRDQRHMAVKEGQVSSMISSHDRGMNVRIVTRSGTGFASCNAISKQDGLRLLQKAYRQAKAGRRRAEVSLSPEPAVKTDWEVHQRRPLVDVGTDEKLKYIQGLDRAVMKTKVKVQGRFIELKDYETESYFANSEGSRIRSFLPRVVLDSFNHVSSKGESAQSIRSWGASGGWEKVESWALEEVLPQEIKMLKTQLDKGRGVKPGTYDLVCGPEVAGIAAHESCGHPMEADRIIGREMSQAGRSFVSPDMIGGRIGSEYATVIDDPTLPGAYGYYAYDEEGVKARPRFLYKAGIINEFLHNRETASRLGVQSNGSSRSEFYLREPIVRMANTFVAPGDFEDDEIFGDVKEGVLMHSFTEWNIDDKRYNQKYVSREAYFIKDGEIAGPAKNCVLEITTPGFWGSIDAVSKKLDFVSAECGKGDPMQGMPVFTGGPMVRLRKVALR